MIKKTRCILYPGVEQSLHEKKVSAILTNWAKLANIFESKVKLKESEFLMWTLLFRGNENFKVADAVAEVSICQEGKMYNTRTSRDESYIILAIGHQFLIESNCDIDNEDDIIKSIFGQMSAGGVDIGQWKK